MANNYVQFSEMINITTEEAEWIKEYLKEDATHEAARLCVNENEEEWPGFEWEIQEGNVACEHLLSEPPEAHTLWLHCDEMYNQDNLITFMQTFIDEHRPEFIFSLTEAASCSKPRVGEFGGGWLVIHKDGYDGGNTWQAAEACSHKLKLARRLKEEKRIEEYMKKVKLDTDKP